VFTKLPTTQKIPPWEFWEIEKAVSNNKSFLAFTAANEQGSQGIKLGLFLPMRNGCHMHLEKLSSRPIHGGSNQEV